ncbi:S8 family serine peptidase [Bifidobacterium leontopitheci]|uniref:Serine protease n=1 Tax=Bifidobacterium leontopitheci TaxID=2650774 RepID=A0A6I1GBG0_9BIFI|nr:S8 family serine peptidase [Bifidobacterium leontopitheci]KAB7788983.1 serine protease [Bifidobacterium leontopitheci]
MKQKTWAKWVALAACAAMAAPVAATASAATNTASSGFGQGVMSSRLTKANGTKLVFIQTVGRSGLEVSGLKGTSTKARLQMKSAAVAAANKAAATANGVFDQLKKLDPSAKRVYTTSYTVPGVAVYADSAALRTLAERNANVVKISPITLKTATTASTADTTAANAKPANADNDALTRALSAWTQTGKTGKGVNIAIMDTGLDYTHADFGGPGTTAAYQEALNSKTVPAGTYDSAKFLGGTDLAGTDYYPNDNVHTTPDPDSNPIDGEGGHHGTHVAGTAAGYGVTKDGKSAKDVDYTKLSEADVRSMTIAPGSAPQAGIYSVKVFGDNGGSTGLVGAGLDWVAENLAKGEKIDILSMSLGGGYGTPDDPDTAKVDALTKQGVLSVVAAGNDGDYTDIMGSPATAPSSLAVAASQSGGTLQDSITATAPSDIADTKLPGQYSQNYTKLEDFSVTGKVVKVTDPDNLNGCSAYSDADAAAVKGNIAWVEWDDANVACGSGTRFNNAEKAGAVGIIFASQSKMPSAGIAGNADIPGFQVTAPGVEKIQKALDAGTLEVKLSSDQRMSMPVNYADELSDTVADFTSRGLHGSADGTVKPDVAAPGVGIVSASAGTGTKPEVMSGTSMATPLTSGVAALTFEAHPGWTPEQVKAAVMNTADHDVTISKNGTAMSPIRVGTGRIDALNAVNNPVTVADKDDTTAVTGQFGIVQVPKAGYKATKTFTVTNNSDKAVSYDVAYQPRTETPGVTYTVSTSKLDVPANGSATFDVTLDIPDQSALKHTRDTTQPVKNPSLSTHNTNYVTDASGIVRLAPVSGSDATFSALRVAVSSAPRPASETKSSITLDKAGSREGTLKITGDGFTGSGENSYTSEVVPMQLLAEDPAGDEASSAETARSAAAGDIRAFGYTTTARQVSDPSQAYLVFGLQTSKTWSRLGNNFIPDVLLDTNGDGQTDYEVAVSTAEPISGKSTGTDAVWVETIDEQTGNVVDSEPLPDSVIADSNVVVLPTKLSAIGVTSSAQTKKITARPIILSSTAANVSSSSIADYTDGVQFDALNPYLWYGDEGQSGSGTYTYADKNGTTVAAHLGAGPNALKAQGLILHLNGVDPVKSTDETDNIDIQDVTAPAEVDKTKLQTLVDTAKQLKESDYTADSWAALKTALDAAEKTLADENATQDDVDAAATALQTAIDGLKKAEPAVDKSKLQALVDSTKVYKQSDYTGNSWAAFQAALKSANDVLGNDKATQAEVDAAYDALTKAIDGLVKAADKTKLQTLVDTAKQLKESDYTADSWKTFADALKNAEDVLGNDGATQAEVDAAATKLQTAIDGLKKPTPQLDTTKLTALVDSAKAIKNDGYTKASWAALQKALKSAEGVLTDKNATQEQVNAAYAALTAAVDGLAKEPAPQPKPQPGTAKPGSGNGAGAPSQSGSNGKGNGLGKTGAAVESVAAFALLAVIAGAGVMVTRRKMSR